MSVNFQPRLRIAGLNILWGLLFTTGLTPSASQDGVKGPISELPAVISSLTGSVCESPGGRYLTSVNDGIVRVYDRKLEKVVKNLTNGDGWGRIQTAFYTPDGRYLITDTQNGRFIFWPTRHHVAEFILNVKKTNKMYYMPAVVSPDSRLLAVGRLSNDPNNGDLLYEIDFFDLQTRRFARRLLVSRGLDTSPGHSPYMDIAFHPQGRYLATAIEYDQGHHSLKHEWLRIYDLQTRSWAWQMHGAPPISYSANGEYFAFQSPIRHLERNHHHWALRLWNTRANKFKSIDLRLDYGTERLSLSPDGNYLLTDGADKLNQNPQLNLYSTRSGARLQSLNMVGDENRTHVFSRSGRELFSFVHFYDQAPLEIRRVD